MKEVWYKNLIGAQLVCIHDEYMVVRKGDKDYIIDFELDQGDCCGYARLEQELFFKTGSGRNPIITNVIVDKEEDNTYCDNTSTEITFFGEYKPLAAVSCECGSGSGWQYGAAVTFVCKSLNINETVCHW